MAARSRRSKIVWPVGVACIMVVVAVTIEHWRRVGALLVERKMPLSTPIVRTSIPVALPQPVALPTNQGISAPTSVAADQTERVLAIADKELASLRLSLELAAMPMQKRIDEQVALLRAESTQDSLNMLSEVEMFYWPGHRHDGAGVVLLPLPPKVGSEFVDSVMSNRRFLKLMDEMNVLTKADASAFVAEQVHKTLPIYQRLFEDSLSRLIDNIPRVPPNTPSSAGLSIQVNNNSDHTPTLGGLRLKLLALALIAGNLSAR